MQHLQKTGGHTLQAKSSPPCSTLPTFGGSDLRTFQRASVSTCLWPASHLPYALPSSVSRNPFVCHSYENCRVTSFKPKVFLFPRRALSLLFSLFVPRAFHNSFRSKGIRTLSKNSRVYPNNLHARTHLPSAHPPFFSCTYVEPILQPLYFYGLPSNGGCTPLQQFRLPRSPAPLRYILTPLLRYFFPSSSHATIPRPA